MRRVAFAVLSTIAGLVGLLSFKTEATGSATTSSVAAGTSSAGTSHSSGTSASSAASSSSSSNPTAGGSSRSGRTKTTTTTVTGSVAETQYGPVQVRITVTNRKVTSAAAVEYPSQDPRDAQINAYAIPVLQRETLGTTSADQVDMVSGATYTSEGYLQSLQSALDKAGL
jgi:uncharacterized protein with FMN-binding domain